MTAPASSGLPALLDHWLNYRQASERIPGLVAALDVSGDRIFDGSYGEAHTGSRAAVDVNTIFRLASVSKVFTAVAVMQLVERGDVALDEPIAKRGWSRIGRIHE